MPQTVTKTWNFTSNAEGWSNVSHSTDNSGRIYIRRDSPGVTSVTSELTLTFDDFTFDDSETISSDADILQVKASFTWNAPGGNRSDGGSHGFDIDTTELLAEASFVRNDSGTRTGNFVTFEKSADTGVTLKLHLEVAVSSQTPPAGQWQELQVSQLVFDVEYDEPQPLEIDGESRTDTRSVVDIHIVTPTDISVTSATASRSVMEISTLLELSGVSQTDSSSTCALEDIIVRRGNWYNRHMYNTSQYNSEYEEIVGAIEITGRTATANRSSVAVSTSVALIGVSSTDSRSTVTVISLLGITMGSATDSRTFLAVHVGTGIQIRAPTDSRTELSLLTVVSISLSSQTASDSSTDISTGIAISGLSQTDNRTVLNISTATDISGVSQTDSRCHLEIAIPSSLSGLSQTDNRSRADISVEPSLPVSGRSATDSRAYLDLPFINITGTSQTGSASSVVILSELEISGESRTNNSAKISIDTEVSISGESRTGTSSSCDIGSLVALSGESRVDNRAIVVVDIDDSLRITGVSSTDSRSILAVDTKLTIYLRSETDSLSILEIDIGVNITGESRTESRSYLDIPEEFTLSSRTDSRAVVDANTHVLIERISVLITGIGSYNGSLYNNLQYNAGGTEYTGGGVSRTNNRSVVDAIFLWVDGKSITGSRAELLVDTLLQLHLISRTFVRTFVDVRVPMEYITLRLRKTCNLVGVVKKEYNIVGRIRKRCNLKGGVSK